MQLTAMVMKNDDVLSEFISQTGADASLATDLLTQKSWDLISALKAYQSVCGLRESTPDIFACGELEPEDKPLDVKISTVATNGHIVTNGGGEHMPPANPTTNGVHEPRENGRISRGLSKTVENGGFVTNARLNVAKGLAQAAVADSKKECHIETPSYAFTLPNLTTLPVDFRKFLEKDIIETSTLRGLEASGHLNWWTVNGVAQKLWPLATSGDGNCLLHAASLGMWGFHDRLLILRKALYLILTKGSRRHALWRRWRWQQHYANKQAGLIYSETEWRDEWTNLVRLASPQPRSKPTSTEPLDPDRIESPLPNSVIDDDDDYYPDQIYESLEEIHVFALAHVLKRPVLVVADTVLRNANGEEFAPIPFGGIYLPLECSPNECHRSPLVLCYDAAHFSALVTMQQESSANAGRAIIPITDKERRLLPVHFACDPGPDFTWWSDAADRRIAERTALTEQQKLQLICRYLDVIKIPLRRASTLGRRDPADHIPLRMQPLPRRSGSLTNIQEEMTRSSSRSKFINDLTASLRKKFMVRSRNRSLNRQSKDAADREKAAREESQTAGTKTKTRESARKLPLSAAELRDVNCLVGAQLHTEAHHQYMEEMVKNYLRSARQRFDAEQARRTAPGANGAGRISNAPTRRERISRSFSASSIVVSCMNGDCEQQASHATNFLCSDCFRHQKELMTSFTTVPRANGALLMPGSVPSPSTAVKSHTMPSMHSMAKGLAFVDAETVDAVAPPPTAPAGRTSSHILAVRQRKNSQASTEETRQYGVAAVTGPAGVTHYYFPAETQFCRSPHCANYSNGHPTLCTACAKPPSGH